MPSALKRSPAAIAAAALLGGVAWARRRRRVPVRGSTVLITGGSRGLGLVLARELVHAGARRLVLCARDAADLESARRGLLRRGADVLAVSCDVSDPDAVQRMVAAARDRFGRIDILVNDASIMQVAPAEVLSLGDLRAAMDVNFWGTVHTTLAVLPEMRERGAGRIVNVTSIGGAVAVPHLLAYTSAKFAAVGFSTGLGEEVAKDGVAVTTVVPGLMRTGSFLNALVKGRRDDEATLFSVLSSLPVLTMDAGRAARRILVACERGERFVTLGMPAKALRLANALAPGLTQAVLAAVTPLLPGPGEDSPSALPSPAGVHRRLSLLTTLGERAAAENNEEQAFQR